jgi:hypothetical protein
MPHLDTKQLAALLERSNLDFTREEEGIYVVDISNGDQDLRVQVTIDQENGQRPELIIEAIRVMTIPVNHPDAAIVYHELLSRAGFPGHICPLFSSRGGSIGLFTVEKAPVDAGCDDANLEQLETLLARFADDVASIVNLIDAAVATRKTWRERQADKVDRSVTTLFSNACDEFALGAATPDARPEVVANLEPNLATDAQPGPAAEAA